MDVAFLVFLSSGLFLGWSLGANDAANVFGTAVGSRMVRFPTAVVISAVFVLLGAVVRERCSPPRGWARSRAGRRFHGGPRAALTVYS
jgi:hypothetical protein